MAFDITQKLKLLSEKISIKPNLVLEIDGLAKLFCVKDVSRYARYGDDIYYGDDGLYYGGTITDDRSLPYIRTDETTRTISQQIEPDKGSSSSVSNMVVSMVDKDQLLSEIFSPGFYVDDVIGRTAILYLNFEGSSHPDDSLTLFNGVIDQVTYGVGIINVSISHPEQLKRQEIIQKFTGNLSGAINDSVTSITLETVQGLFLPQDILETCIVIEDEIIKYTGISTNTLTGCTRGYLDTVPATHDDESECESFYIIEDHAVDMALKLFLSGSGNYESFEATSFNIIGATDYVENAVFLNGIFNFERTYGVVLGDLITTTGTISNDVTEKPILSISENSLGTILVIDDVTFSDEIGASGTITIKSKYDTLPDGCGCKMTPRQVDVVRHEFYKDLLATGFPTMKFYIKESLNAKEFVDKEVYFPSTLFSIPRGGMASVGMVLPPISTDTLVKIGIENVTNPQTTVIKRSMNKHFYNSVEYRYEILPLEDKYLRREIILSELSLARIPVGNKPLLIESDGMRDNEDTTVIAHSNARRLLEKYRYAPDSISVKVMFGTGYKIELGDVVLFDGSGLGVTDITRGSRDFGPRLMEVIDKKFNILGGSVELTMLNTAYTINGRYATIGPSSALGSGSTKTRLILKDYFGKSTSSKPQRQKWEIYIGEKVRVHSTDYTFDETVTLESFDSSNEMAVIVSELSSAPLENYIMDQPKYPDSTDEKENQLWKTAHMHLTPRVTVVSGSSQTSFTVADGDISKFFVGAYIEVHSDDFLQISEERQVLNIDTITNTITVGDSLGFVPAINFEVDLVGFKDGGLPYRII